jgi:hypothetical protein
LDDAVSWWKSYTGSFTGSPRGCDANASENGGGGTDSSVGAGDLTCTVLLFFGDTCGTPPVSAAGTTSAATLQVAGNLVGMPGATVTTPIQLTTDGHTVAAAAFALKFDATHLRFDPTDKDGDSIPDAIHLATPVRFTANVHYNAVTSQIEIALYGASLPLPSLTDAVIATVDLQVIAGSAEKTALVQLSNASLGDDQGRTIALTVNTDGVQVQNLTTVAIYLPLVVR